MRPTSDRARGESERRERARAKATATASARATVGDGTLTSVESEQYACPDGAERVAVGVAERDEQGRNEEKRRARRIAAIIATRSIGG